MQQAQDFHDESEALYAVLEPLSADAYTVPTLFNNWTIDNILQHLHHFNIMADLSLNEPDKFANRKQPVPEPTPSHSVLQGRQKIRPRRGSA